MNANNEAIRSDPLKVAIIGGPNVGKSTLFNRLLGKRRTITDPTPGVTRDPVASRCAIDDLSFELLDTGGYQAGENDELTVIVSNRSVQTGREAALILLVVDVLEMSPNDEALIEKLHPYREKIILVVNKVDNEKRESLVWNYYKLGFERIVGVSASHGRNIALLKSEIYNSLKNAAVDHQAIDNVPSSEIIKLAILGKPNTGKSTLINRLLGEERSIVSEVPGTTRDVIEGRFRFEGRTIEVVDTAGIRRKKKVRGTVEHYSVSRAISAIKACEVALLLLDAREGLTDQDKKIAALIVKEGKGIILVLNKWDLMENTANLLQAMTDRISFLFPVLRFAPVRAISSKTGFGVKEVLALSLTIKDQLARRVSTSTLNKAVSKWIAEYSPPTARGRAVKIRYGTQVSCNPVMFVFFANLPQRLADAYVRYLTNRIREELGFRWIPLRVEIRQN